MANPTEQDIQKDAEKIFKDSIDEVLPKILKQIKNTEPVPVVLEGKAYKEITEEEQKAIAATGKTTLVRKGFTVIGTNPTTGEETQSGSLTQSYWENRMMDGVKDAVRAKVTGVAKPAANASELDSLIPPALEAPQEASQDVKEAVTKIYLKGMSGYEAHVNSNREKPVTGIFKDAIEAVETADKAAKGIPVKARAAEPLEEPKRLLDDKFNPIKRISDEIRKGATGAAAAMTGSGVKILGLETLNEDGTANPRIPVTEMPETTAKGKFEKPRKNPSLASPEDAPQEGGPSKPIPKGTFVNPKTGKPVDPRTAQPEENNHGVKINPLEEADPKQKPLLRFSPLIEGMQDIRDMFKDKKNNKGGPFLREGEDFKLPTPPKRQYNEKGHTNPVTDTLIGAAKDIMQTSGIGPAMDAISNGLHSVAAPLITPPKKLTLEQQEATPLLKDGIPMQPQKPEKQIER